jgi:hypothetical protein
MLVEVSQRKSYTSNQKADQAAKEALDKDISTTERHPPDDLKKWLIEEDFKKRDQRWKNGNNEMKEWKQDVDRKEDTKGMPRKEQVAISRLRAGYTSVIHGPKMEDELYLANRLSLLLTFYFIVYEFLKMFYFNLSKFFMSLKHINFTTQLILTLELASS